MSTKKVLYFGYGANSSLEMIEALIGRKPRGFQAKLMNYGLFLQDWKEMPIGARKILKNSWNNKFKSYISVPRRGATIWGVAWEMTEQERDIIGKWELHHIWYKPVKIKIENVKEKVFDAQTEIILKTNMEIITERNYKKFPLDQKRKMLRLAMRDREAFLSKFLP